MLEPDGEPSGEHSRAEFTRERLLVARRINPVALSNISRPTVRIRVGASVASVDLLYVNLDLAGDALNCFRQWLSNDELAKAGRFHSDLHRARYVVGRATLRCLLADRIGYSPSAIRFSYGENGKPILGGDGANVEFNLAHSGGEAVIALAEGAVVGVDIELLRPISGIESLARLVFSEAERRELALAPDPALAFLTGWTRKEAYVKALGLGLSAPLMEITVSLSERAQLLSTGLRDQAVSGWRLLNVAHPHAVVALALGPRPDCDDTTRGETTDSTQIRSYERVNS